MNQRISVHPIYFIFAMAKKEEKETRLDKTCLQTAYNKVDCGKC
jgi:hypothetical protein